MENIIKSIDPGSPLRHRAAPGDRLIAINGHKVLDVLGAADTEVFSRMF